MYLNIGIRGRRPVPNGGVKLPSDRNWFPVGILWCNNSLLMSFLIGGYLTGEFSRVSIFTQCYLNAGTFDVVQQASL